jgi:hypothetical protein
MAEGWLWLERKKLGWLEDQFKEVEREVRSLPAWMRREAGFEGGEEKLPRKSGTAAKEGKTLSKTAGAGRRSAP